MLENKLATPSIEATDNLNADLATDGVCEVKEVINTTIPNSETSLRHLFYLEYKNKFQDGQVNPIVYSRFGKMCYDSNEQFNPSTFN